MVYKKSKYDLLTNEALKSMPKAETDMLQKDDMIEYVQEIDETTHQKVKVGKKKLNVFDNKPFNSKLFSLLIDGLVYLDKAYMKSVSVTFSKHTAKSSEKYNGIGFSGDYPIWAELDVQIESIVPAISSMLWDSLTTKGSTILTNKISGG
jgi:hypothetical protein